MGPRYAPDSAYDSDDSTLVNERRRPDPRYRSRSEDDYFRPRSSRRPSSPQRSRSFRDDAKTSSPYKTVGKVALGIVLVEVVAHVFSKWQKGKAEEREKERRKERKRQFEKAKARRRREEERLDRMQEERERRAMDEEWYEGSEIPTARRLGYVHPDRDESPKSPPRRIEAAPEWDDEDDDYEERRPQPQRSGRSQSRPARGYT